MNDLEKFIKGEPLTDRLAALKNGESEQEVQPVRAPVKRNLRELDDDDREHLRRLQLEPGWSIFLRVLDRAIKRQEDLVKDTSMDDPLANRDRVAADWAYVGTMKKFRAMAENLVEAEIRLMEVEKSRAKAGEDTL